MKLTYQLTKEDYLSFYTYSANSSPQIQKRLQIAKWSVPAMQCLIAAFYIYRGMYFGAGILLVLGVLWLFFYPRFLKKRYDKFYSKHIDQNHSHEFGKTLEAHVTMESILVKDGENEATISMNEVDHFFELEEVYVFQMNNRSGIIIPKNAEGDLEELRKTYL